jgi:hypothetical protein
VRAGRVATPLAFILLILAAPVAIWYVVGDLSTSPLPPAESDYLVRPPRIFPWVENSAGILALVLIVVCALVLYQNLKRGLVSPRGWLVLALLLPAGLIVGLTGRVVTAGVIEANIGGGLMIMFALPVAGMLILAAFISLFVARR